MITTVTLNPAIDKIVEISHLTLGEVHRVGNQVITLGGKSINVARLLSGFNTDTKAVCFAGKDNFDIVKRHAKEDNIPLVPIIVDSLTRTNVKIIEPDVDYRTTDINEIGFTISQEKLIQMTALIKDCAKDSDYIVLSGSLPTGVPTDYYKQIAQLLKKETNVIIDADGEVLRLGIEGSPFLIKPNIHELESAYNKTLDTDDKIVTLCKSIINEHDISYILVSMGSKGSILVGNDIVLKADVIPVNVVSTVGAGDSMLAGMIFGLTGLTELNIKERLRTSLSYGVASSSIAISTKEHVSIQEKDLIATANTVTIIEL